jgi:eukaryotic-like serine/threonine-protein kinase
MAADPVSQFLTCLRKSQLLEDDSVRAVLSKSSAKTVEELAGEFLAVGFLTAFQLEKLRAKSWQGLKLGPYSLLYPIGRGGVGIVYLCRNDRLAAGRVVPRLSALKLLSPKKAVTEPRTRERFLREQQIGPLIPEHPNLARTIDTGEHQGVLYLVMEYVPGPTAKAWVRTNGPMPVGLATRLFADVSLGLHAAHQAGFVHRDTKPSNVVVLGNGRAKLLDFGFALKRGETPPADPTILGGRGYTLGTMDYLPPEQATNAVAVGAETDIYSLGCSLYYLLTGLLPFPGGTAQEKMRRHQRETPEAIEKINKAVPKELSQFIGWLMCKKPEDRPQSAAQVAQELERWASPILPIAELESYGEHWEKYTLEQVHQSWFAHHSAKPTP